MNSPFQAILYFAKSENFEFALSEANLICNELKDVYLYEMMELFVNLSTIAISFNNTYYAAKFAEKAIDIHPRTKPSKEVKALLTKFALGVKCDFCSPYFYSIYSKIIELVGDEDHEIRKHQLMSHYVLPIRSYDTIQRTFLDFFDECLKNENDFEYINDEIYEMFVKFLWKCALIIADKHSINAFFLRAVLYVAGRGDKFLASVAARNLFDYIKKRKPDEIEISVFNHPLFRFTNFATNVLLDGNFEAYNRLCYSYEKLLYQDVEIPVYLETIYQKYFKVKQ